MARSVLIGALATFLVLCLICLVLGLITGIAQDVFAAFRQGLDAGLNGTPTPRP